MNTKYTLIIFGSLFTTSLFFMYLLISDNLDNFIAQLKWFMRITAPFLIIFLFYIGKKDEN